MLTKCTSLCLVFALMTTLCWRSTFAQSASLAMSESGQPAESHPGPTATSEGRSNERLKEGMATLVRDAKAGKIAPAAKTQIQPATSNNLSKKQKIAIVAVAVGVALVITAIVVYKGLEWDCKARCVL